MKRKMQNAEASFNEMTAKLAASVKAVGVLEENAKTEKQYERRNILENKAAQVIGYLSESNGYRMWNRMSWNNTENQRGKC